ncbi:MAG TPA: mechanosensitive ion channel family protein [Nevskiaceae bacterium]|nr:mechanosensitive ion channel family protein [Nevskiaceae bacterium]
MDEKQLHAVLTNPPLHWALAAGIAAGIYLLALLFKRVLLRRLSALAGHTSTKIDDVALMVLQSTQLWLVLVVAIEAGTQMLDLPGKLDRLCAQAATVAVFLQVGFWAGALAEYFIARNRERALATNAGAATSLAALNFIVRIALWALVVLLALDNLGINITALVAGLGIGGVAVALAVQNILGDLFASLSIVIDKPFVIGDFIICDTYMGTVEYVGLKTTRLRSLDGEQIIFSNGDLLKARVRNYKRMFERRVLWGFDVVYQTTPEQLQKIPALMRELIEAQKKVRFERAHFAALKDTGLHFESVYWVLDPDYNLYMDIQQALYLELLRRLSAMGVTLAYSSVTARPDAPNDQGAALGRAQDRADDAGGDAGDVADAARH